MPITYEELKKTAFLVRAELVRQGVIDPSRGKIRRRPREKDKSEMLYLRAMNRLNKYRPSLDREGRLILPYFSTQRS